jgi:hypothetical protein
MQNLKDDEVRHLSCHGGFVEGDYYGDARPWLIGTLLPLKIASCTSSTTFTWSLALPSPLTWWDASTSKMDGHGAG